jgi:hypothetical protein
LVVGACGEAVEAGQAAVDGVLAGGELVGVGEFVVGGGDADGESFDVTEPTLLVSFGDAVVQVVAEFDEAGALGGVGAQYGAADAGFSAPSKPTRRPSGQWCLAVGRPCRWGVQVAERSLPSNVVTWARSVGAAKVRSYKHVHGWRDERWESTLALEQLLTDEDLARMIDSIPPN